MRLKSNYCLMIRKSGSSIFLNKELRRSKHSLSWCAEGGREDLQHDFPTVQLATDFVISDALVFKCVRVSDSANEKEAARKLLAISRLLQIGFGTHYSDFRRVFFSRS